MILKGKGDVKIFKSWELNFAQGVLHPASRRSPGGRAVNSAGSVVDLKGGTLGAG